MENLCHPNRVFTPREYLIRRRVQMKRYKKAWQGRHPERSRALFRLMYHKHRAARLIQQSNYRSRKRATNPNWLHERYLKYRSLHLARSLCRRNAGKEGRAVIRQWIEQRINALLVPCAYCSSWISPRLVEIDHVIPLSRGGTHDVSNLAVACKPCNRSKSNKLLHEWKP